MTPDNFNIFGNYFQFFSSLSSSETIFLVKIISLAVTALLSIAIVIIFSKINEITTHVPVVAPPDAELSPEQLTRQYNTEWQEIRNYINSTIESQWKLAVIEGDKTVDDALKTAGFPGETMGERLMSPQASRLYALQDLWDAHKLRNYLVHDISVTLTQPQAATAVAAFEKALRELGMLSI